MAATVSSVWAKPGTGSWALDAEENEAELQQQQERETKSKQETASADFPSLSAAVSTKSKKKKGQTLSLAEFSTYSDKPKSTFQPSFQSKGLTHEDMLSLPTGPRERTAEELERSRHGGFRSYGNRGGEDSSNSRWGSNSRGSDDTRRSGAGGGFGRDSSTEFMPSRADENDNWAEGKKSGFGNGPERREREKGGSGGGFFDSLSKADDSDSWVSNKSFVPSEGRRFGGGGGGFERERRGGFESNNGGGGADMESWGKKREEGSGIVSNGSSGRPKLNLQPRTLPVIDVAQQAPAIVPKPKGSNPFGEARPREEVLAEKGQDWKKIDEQLDSMKIKELGLSAGAADEPAKRSFGGGNDRRRSPENRVERSWRKPDSDDARPQSAEKVENEVAEEN